MPFSALSSEALGWFRNLPTNLFRKIKELNANGADKIVPSHPLDP
jgi:hypothetical protein